MSFAIESRAPSMTAFIIQLLYSLICKVCELLYVLISHCDGKSCPLFICLTSKWTDVSVSHLLCSVVVVEELQVQILRLLLNNKDKTTVKKQLMLCVVVLLR